MLPIRLEFGVQKPESKEVVWLSYELLEHPFQRMWLAANLRELAQRTLWGCRFGALCVDEADYRLRIKQAFERLIKSLPDSERVPFDELNFEAVPYIPRQKIEILLKLCTSTVSTATAHGSTSRIKKNADSLASLLRHYVQLYFPEYHYHVSLKTFSPSLFELPKEADQLFTVDRHDGWLYLDYEGEGLNAIASFDEKNILEFEAQTRFSGCAQLLYRDEFDGRELDYEVRTWLEASRQNSKPRAWNIGLVPLARPIHGLHRHVVRDLFKSTETPVQFRAFQNGNALCASDLNTEYQKLIRWHPWGKAGLVIAKMLRQTCLERPVGAYLDGYHRFEGVFWFIKKPLQPLLFYARYQIRTGFHDYRQYLRYFGFKAAKPFVPSIYFVRRQMQNGFLDVRIMATVYLSRVWTATTAPIHWMRPHAFNLYFKVSKPIRKLYYFISFQFRKRVLRRDDMP